MESESLPADASDVRLVLTAAQRRVADTQPGATISIVGPAGSGKTTALAAHAEQLEAQGQKALVICSHPSGVRAFHDARAALGARSAAADAESSSVATLSDHAASWMHASYAAARVSPNLRVGDQTATRTLVLRAARGLLDMSWPLFARVQLNLDLPHLSRPDAFLDEAASLITLLQRTRIGPEEFEAGCAAGLAAFYGENVERAVVLLHDPQVRERASQRGREACRASATALALQRAAERDVAAILAQLYREFLAAATLADLRSPEDIIDAAIRWLGHDQRSAQEIMRPFASIIVDDAEDGEPGLSALVSVLKDASGGRLLVAGWEHSRIDGLEGRRSGLSLADGGTQTDLAPLGAKPTPHFERLASETQEVAWLAARITDLLGQGESAEAIAVLCRGEDTAAAYARLLREYSLSISLPGSAYESEAELLDLLSLCALVQDPFQPDHLLRVLSSGLFGFSDATLWTLCRDPLAAAQLALPVGEPSPSAHAGSGGTTLASNVLFGAADALLDEPQRLTLSLFRTQLAQWQRAARSLSAPQLLANIVATGGFLQHWQQETPYIATRLIEDARRLIESVSVMESASPVSFADAASRFAQGTLWLPRAQPAAGAVVSTSIAAAKGRRWPHVFVAGIAHERFPRVYTSHAIAFSRTYGLIVRENVARGASQTAKYAWYYAKFAAKSMYLDGERDALHYGLARATVSATASGYGSPPRWAREQDLLATEYEAAKPHMPGPVEQTAATK